MARSSWAFWVLLFAASVTARNRAPLIDEDITRTRNKAAECVFGKQVRELNSQWIPDLGVPIGVLYCMKCECVPLQKKRRIVARVQCRSIKNECPEPTCDEPVHLPGRCCKSCPGDTFNPDVIQDIVPQNIIDEEEKSTKHFAALLTDRSSLILKNDNKKSTTNDLNKNNVVATGRFSFHKKNLHYSFYISDKAARPRSLQFVDSDGNILEEFVLSRAGGLVNSYYQNATRKVCGVWRRLPRDYRRLLKQERLYAVLVWGVKDQAEFTLSGQLMKYVPLGTENFSSLLEPAPGTTSVTMAGAGGTAIVSISTSVSTSIHIAVIFNGLFTSNETSEVPVNISLSMDEKKYVLHEIIHVKKPMHELNFVEFSSPVSSADLRLLTRGKLLLTIASVSRPQSLRLSGNVITKVTCELFQAALASSPQDHNANPYGTSGLAWLYLNNEGALVYNVRIENLKEEQIPPVITLVDISTKRKTELEDLSPYFVNGWANGTLEKLSPKVLEPLYSGNLAVNVATQKDNSLIKGRLVAKPVADARDAPAPFLLKRENYTLPTSAVGLAWLAVDDDCHIHYDISLFGLGNSEKRLELHLELLPMLAPGAPVTSRVLVEDFQGNQVEGSPVNSLSIEEIRRLDSGVGFLKIKEKDTGITLLVATIRHVIVPTTCNPHSDNNIPTFRSDGVEEPQPNIIDEGKCFYEGKFYDEETQWTSASNPCTMCFCQNGVKCFNMECPEITCPNSMKPVKLSGECCPSCTNTSAYPDNNRNTPQKCVFSQKQYSPGSKFHPFLIPNGFDTCTVCTCDPTQLEIQCTRISNEKECCRNCQDHLKVPLGIEAHPRILVKKENPSKTIAEIMSAGGCKNNYNPKKPYENGAEYHPFIDSLGEYKCVTCKCENGDQSCKRKHCDKQTCEKMWELKRKGNKVNSSEFCCSFRQCKQLRKKLHRPQVKTR